MTRIIEQKLNEEDYTAMDIAAAFLKQALGENDQNNDRGHMEDFGDTGAEAGMVRLFINIGKNRKSVRAIFSGQLQENPVFRENWSERLICMTNIHSLKFRVKMRLMYSVP